MTTEPPEKPLEPEERDDIAAAGTSVPATADGLRVIDPPGLQRFPLGEVWEGNIDFIAVVPPGSLVWRTTPDDPARAEVLRNRLRTRLMAAIPDLRIYDPQVGFFYTADDLVDMLKITHTTLTRRVKAGRLLAIDTPGAAPRYPQVQFHRDGRLLAGLPDMLALLQPAMTGREIAVWLARPTTTGQSPATLLDLGQLDTAVQAARREVERIRNAHEERAATEDSDA